MDTKERLPPSGRDFGVYRRVTVEQQTTRDVATAARLSQTRVCQIVQRVGEYMLAVLPPGEEGDKARQMWLAEQIAAARVQFLLRLAVRSFERSQGNQRTERQVKTGAMPGGTVVTLRSTQGDPRYLTAAARLALLGAKLPATNLAGLIGDEAETDEWEVEERDAEEAVTPAAPNDPQDRDCSRPSAELGAQAASPTDADGATSMAAGDCEVNPSQAWTDLRIAPPTVQPLVSLPANEAADESQVATRLPLSKRDRKARQRLLEQKRRGASRAG